jgi:uncharacterized repeat protein (TIGR01451 family)
LAVRNHGPAPATGVVISDVLAPGLIPLWTELAPPLCGRQGRSVSCDAGLLRDGDAITATLDLSVGGTGTPVTGTQLAGLSWGLSRPACVVDRTAMASVVTCGLASLQPGADTYVRVGLAADAGITGALVHSVSVAANERDTNRLNDHVSFTATVGGKVSVPGEPMSGAAALGTADLVLEAEGPASVAAGQPFTYTYTITNRGTQDATAVRFENPVPPATVLNAYAPALPLCRQRDDTFLCALRDPESGAVITFGLVITGHSGLPMEMSLDPLMPGWPICTVLKEKPWLHIVTCQLGTLEPDQATHVQLALIATGVNERLMTNTASVSANEADPNLPDNTHTSTITVQISADVLVRSALPGPAVTGEMLSYTLTTVNLGPSDADVSLIDTLPVGTRFVSADSSRGDDCRAERGGPAGDTVACNLGRMSRGERVAVDVVVEVGESLMMVEELTHSAQVMVEQHDPDLSNNELTQIIPVSHGSED